MTSNLCFSKLASIFQNWKTNDPHEPYLYDTKQEVLEYAKRDPNNLYYDIGMGRVNPAVLKELYEEQRAKVVAKPQSEKDELLRSLYAEAEPMLEK